MNKDSMRIKILDDGKYLQINETTIFPAIYLRDNCPDSFHSTTFQREVPVWDLPCDLRIQNAKFLGNDRVQITYSDGYVSGIPLHFLLRIAFNLLRGKLPRNFSYGMRNICLRVVCPRTISMISSKKTKFSKFSEHYNFLWCC